MKLLLDTHMLLWAAAGTLPEKAEILVGDACNTLYFSAASIWVRIPVQAEHGFRSKLNTDSAAN